MSKRITREELFEAVWSKPIKSLAEAWNTTYLRLVQACAAMEIPRPGQGHWQMIARGRTVEREPLPERTGAAPQEFDLEAGAGRQEKNRPADAPTPIGDQRKELVGVVRAEVEDKLSNRQDVDRENDLARAVERAVLDIVRQASRIDFWKASIIETHRPENLATWFKVDKGVKLAEAKLQKALKNCRKDYRTFQVNVTETAEPYYGRSALSVVIRLREEFEWKDAWEEAWGLADIPNPHCLSDNALRLYRWAKGPKNTGTIMDWNKVGARAGLRGSYHHIEDHLQEIQIRADASIRWERGREGRGWQEPLRVWFGTEEFILYHHGPLNPALGLDLETVKHADLERFKNWLHGEILKSGFPDGTEPVGVFDLRNRRAVKLAFSKLPASCGDYGPMAEFFDALRLVDGVEIRYDFAEGYGPWLVICEPEEGLTWKEIKTRLTIHAQEIPIEEKYELSVESRSLLKWILDLRSREYLMGMTPPVEPHLEIDIGINAEWAEDNARACLELLVDEINEKTEFDLRTIAWCHYSEEHTRILVKKKPSDIDGVVLAVQALGFKRNRLLDGAKVRAAIEGVLGS